MVRKHLKSITTDFSDASVKQYLHDLTKGGMIFDAGRGWYSTVKKAYVLDTEPIKPYVEMIHKKYPLLPFSCWSNAQIRSHFHHMRTRFITFIYADSDYNIVLFDFLRETYGNVYLNPRTAETRKNFIYRDHNLVLRPTVTEAPVEGHFATTEKLLVDLYMENDRMALLDEREYDRTLQNLAESGRINIARMLRYAQRREVKKPLTDKIYQWRI